MAHKSGVRVDKTGGTYDDGPTGYEITYMGNFQMCITSQTLYIRSLTDLIDLRDHLTKTIEEEVDDA